MRNAATQKMVGVGPLDFAGHQILMMNPLSAPLWLGGLVWLLLSGEARSWRALGVVYLCVFTILAAGGTSRASYLAPAYPVLLAAGSIALTRMQATWARRVLRPLATAMIVTGGVALAPFALPILPPDGFLAYMRTIGVKPPAEERSQRAALPQQYADMFGWDEMASKVAAAYKSLPPEDQARCWFFGQNYGEAGALDVLGPRYGLPEGRTLSSHNSYWLWGPGDFKGEVMIILGGDLEDNLEVFEEVTQVDAIECERCMPYEQGLEVYVARRLKVPIADLWPRLKRFI